MHFDHRPAGVRRHRGRATVVFSVDEFGPLNLLPRPERQWVPVARRAERGSPGSRRRRLRRATYTRTNGVRHLLAALDVNRDWLYGHVKVNKNRTRVDEWAHANNVAIACVPTNDSYLNRIECHFAPLRYFALNGTDHRSHEEQNSMIRRYISWRNHNRDHEELRAVQRPGVGDAASRIGERLRATPCLVAAVQVGHVQ